MNNIKFLNLGALDSDASMFVYGEIMDENMPDPWTGEKSTTAFDMPDFKASLDQLRPGQTLNMYFNSPGGSVFVASAMCSMLARLKEKGCKVNSYIDGAAISAASMLVMAADNIYAYKNSMMMIHKPSCGAYGNADAMISAATMLEQVENGTMLPLYMAHAKCKEDDIKSMMAEEKWLTSNEIATVFGAELIDETKQVAAFDKALFANYRNVPESVETADIHKALDAISAKLDKLSPTDEPKNYSAYENILNLI